MTRQINEHQCERQNSKGPSDNMSDMEVLTTFYQASLKRNPLLSETPYSPDAVIPPAPPPSTPTQYESPDQYPHPPHQPPPPHHPRVSIYWNQLFMEQHALVVLSFFRVFSEATSFESVSCTELWKGASYKNAGISQGVAHFHFLIIFSGCKC